MKTINTCLISHQSASALVECAIAVADEMDLRICALVVDVTGRTRAQVVMDGAPLIADELCIKKARTALLGLSSADFSVAVESTGPIGQSMLHQGDITLLGGGVPLMSDGQIVGALAIGGGTVEQDVVCAQEALARYEKTSG